MSALNLSIWALGVAAAAFFSLIYVYLFGYMVARGFYKGRVEIFKELLHKEPDDGKEEKS